MRGHHSRDATSTAASAFDSERGPPPSPGLPTASDVLLSDNLLRRLVLAQSDELRVSEVVVTRPFEELELPDEYGLQPLTVGHLGVREALASSAAPRLW